MHTFDELIISGTSFTLRVLDEANAEIIEGLQTAGKSSEIKNLQMIQLQRTVMAIGMFSLFESILQQGLSCKYGFDRARKLLEEAGNSELRDRFNKYYWAVNVLKHGKGSSYDKLIRKADELPFNLKLENQRYFYEGAVDEVSTYIEVDNDFVLGCADIIKQVSNEIRKIDDAYPF